MNPCQIPQSKSAILLAVLVLTLAVLLAQVSVQGNAQELVPIAVAALAAIAGSARPGRPEN